MKIELIAVAVLLAIAATSGAYIKGSHDGRVACEARVQAAVDKQKAEDAKELESLRTSLAVVEQRRADGEQQVEEYARRLAALPKQMACILTKDDADEINRR